MGDLLDDYDEAKRAGRGPRAEAQLARGADSERVRQPPAGLARTTGTPHRKAGSARPDDPWERLRSWPGANTPVIPPAPRRLLITIALAIGVNTALVSVTQLFFQACCHFVTPGRVILLPSGISPSSNLLESPLARPRARCTEADPRPRGRRAHRPHVDDRARPRRAGALGRRKRVRRLSSMSWARRRRSASRSIVPIAAATSSC